MAKMALKWQFLKFFKIRNGFWGDLKTGQMEKNQVFPNSLSYMGPNEILSKNKQDKNGGMTHPKYPQRCWTQSLYLLCARTIVSYI